MKRWLSKEILAATIALPALSSAAWARLRVLERDPQGRICLRRYRLRLPGGPPMVVAGIRIYDGKGNFTQRDYRGDSVPAEFAPKSATAAVISTKSF